MLVFDLDVGYLIWMEDDGFGCLIWMLDIGCLIWMLDIGCLIRIFDVGCLI